MAAAGCLRKALVRANERREQFVSIMFDQGAMTDELRELMKTVEKGYEGDAALVSIGWMPVVELAALQAADTIATESFWDAKNTICNDSQEHSAHLRSMLGKISLIKGYIMQREHIKAGLKIQRPRPWRTRRIEIG